MFYFADTAEEARSLYDHKTVDAVWPLTEERMVELAADETAGTLAPLLRRVFQLLKHILPRGHGGGRRAELWTSPATPR